MKKKFNCLLFLAVLFGLSSSQFTLTKSSPRLWTSQKPTAVYGRINFDQNETTTYRAPLELIHMRAQELRRSKSRINVWKWDYWCQLQPKMGNGSNSINKYYYDAQIDQCMTFLYSGDNGNKNSFDTLNDCERYCKGASYMTIKTSPRATFCSLQPHAGLCISMFEKFYYDVNEERCKSFIYGGCGGNQNRFSTVNECMTRCNPMHSVISDPY